MTVKRKQSSEQRTKQQQPNEWEQKKNNRNNFKREKNKYADYKMTINLETFDTPNALMPLRPSIRSLVYFSLVFFFSSSSADVCMCVYA